MTRNRLALLVVATLFVVAIVWYFGDACSEELKAFLRALARAL
ncbi:MAG: hypothetical protein ACREPV_06180 [Lysobacter sp.]